MKVFHSDRFVLSLPPGHRFPMSKYSLLRDAVTADLPELEAIAAHPASEGELALVHTPDYIDAVMHGTLGAAQQREIGFPWSARMAQRSVHSVGATIAAARTALQEGVAANLAGGTHHAFAYKGSGFCVFNDVAVAARLLQAEWHRAYRAALRVLVIDLDVHQGNGTAAIFEQDDSVFTFSMHGAKNFPARKERSDLDVELHDGCTDEPYLQALDTALHQLRDAHCERPFGLAFYLAGADPHEGDRLGRLGLTLEGLARRDQRVFGELSQWRLPVAISMAGGYGRDIAVTVQVHLKTLQLALAHHQTWAAMRR
jgi:acetoin utilization deacetylase AcuC-like enzyme